MRNKWLLFGVFVSTVATVSFFFRSHILSIVNPSALTIDNQRQDITIKLNQSEKYSHLVDKLETRSKISTVRLVVTDQEQPIIFRQTVDGELTTASQYGFTFDPNNKSLTVSINIDSAFSKQHWVQENTDFEVERLLLLSVLQTLNNLNQKSDVAVSDAEVSQLYNSVSYKYPVNMFSLTYKN